MKTNDNDKKCQEICFNKYLKVLQTVNKKVKEIGYDNHSMYSYKAYPEYTYWIGIFLSGQLSYFQRSSIGDPLVPEDSVVFEMK